MQEVARPEQVALLLKLRPDVLLASVLGHVGQTIAEVRLCALQDATGFLVLFEFEDPCRGGHRVVPDLEPHRPTSLLQVLGNEELATL